MKKIYKAVILSLPLWGNVASACEPIPAAPAMLAETHLNNIQLDELANQMLGYYQNLDQLTACLEVAISNLDIESEAYDNAFNSHVALIEQIENTREFVIGRYNFHVENALPESVNE